MGWGQRAVRVLGERRYPGCSGTSTTPCRGAKTLLPACCITSRVAGGYSSKRIHAALGKRRPVFAYKPPARYLHASALFLLTATTIVRRPHD